jgi:predicted permease
LASALFAGLPAALQATRHDLHAALKAARTTVRQPLRWVLVALQVALCTLLLSVAALLVSTFRQLRSLDPGFDRDHVITFSADPGILNYTAEQSHSLRSRLMSAVREMPGVVSVAIAAHGLMWGTGVVTTYAPAGQKAPPSEFLNTSLNMVSPDYFETMGMRILSGRNFRAGEPKAKPDPVIVNGAFVRRLYPTGDPIGQQFGQGWQQVAERTNQIVGVVSDAKYRSMREVMKPTVYHVWQPDDNVGFILHVRTRRDPKAIIMPVRNALRSMEPRLPFDEIRTLAEEVDASLWAERMLAWLSAAFSAIAAAMAALGVFGGLAYAIAQSKREIGIRIALGASPAELVRMLSTKPLLFAAIGAAAGLLAFFGLTPALGGMLYGVSAADPLLAAGAAAAVFLTALGASLTAAFGALRVNPVAVLREE